MGTWLIEVIFKSTYGGYPHHIWVAAAFIGLCYYVRLPYRYEESEEAPKKHKPFALIEHRPNADGRVQETEPMQRYQDEDGDIANEFYIKKGKQLYKVPREQLRRIG